MTFRRLFHLALACGGLSLAALPVRPQTTDAPETPAPGNTIITSDELRLDQDSHTAVFTGNVVATGNQFTLHCQEMTVNFTRDNKVDNIVAKGEVIIEQPGRVARCDQTVYFREEDKFVLTGQPSIEDAKSRIEAPKITLYRTTQSMITEGRTRTVLKEGMGASSPGTVK